MRSQHGVLPLTARITAESAQLLGLQPGMAVLAMCKATAVEVRPVRAGGDAAANTWRGKVMRVAQGALGDEVAVQMTPGVQWVGFAAAGSGLRSGRTVSVYMPEAAVVLALHE